MSQQRPGLLKPLVWCGLLLCLLIGINAYQNRRDVVTPPPLALDGAWSLWDAASGDSFQIADPYAVDGTWYRVQLHVHSDRSIDGRWSVADVIRAYTDAGYDFVAITDHDRVTRVQSSGDLILIPAEENTIAYPFWPLGQHAVHLFIDQSMRRGGAADRFAAVAARGGLVQIAHPNWTGNLGSGRWEIKHLLAAGNFTLMEIVNQHSDTRADVAMWHELTVRRGPGQPVWAVAVDDAHDADALDRGWTMVKAASRTLPALREALIRGSLYPSTGINAEFGVHDGMISVRITGMRAADGAVDAGSSTEPPAVVIRFIDARGQVVHQVSHTERAFYSPRGDEGFVRVEADLIGTSQKAWSQPFWLRSD